MEARGEEGGIHMVGKKQREGEEEEVGRTERQGQTDKRETKGKR